jgi:hypothetical protein
MVMFRCFLYIYQRVYPFGYMYCGFGNILRAGLTPLLMSWSRALIILECDFQTNVGKTMPFLPPMTGNGKHTIYKNRDDWGMVYEIVSPTCQ